MTPEAVEDGRRRLIEELQELLGTAYPAWLSSRAAELLQEAAAQLLASVEERDRPVRCGQCDQPVPDAGDIACVDCVASLKAENERLKDDRDAKTKRMWELGHEADALEQSVRTLTEALRELIGAMRAYEMDVEGSAPQKHRDMMQRAVAAIAAVERGKE